MDHAGRVRTEQSLEAEQHTVLQQFRMGWYTVEQTKNLLYAAGMTVEEVIKLKLWRWSVDR